MLEDGKWMKLARHLCKTSEFKAWLHNRPSDAEDVFGFGSTLRLWRRGVGRMCGGQAQEVGRGCDFRLINGGRGSGALGTARSAKAALIVCGNYEQKPTRPAV